MTTHIDYATVRMEGKDFYIAIDVLDAYPDIFGHYRSNLKVEEELVLAGVIEPQECTPQSGGRLYIRFADKTCAEAFVDRFNAYIRRLWALI